MFKVEVNQMSQSKYGHFRHFLFFNVVNRRRKRKNMVEGEGQRKVRPVMVNI